MTRYLATIHHHSISRARRVPVGDDLTIAKRNASREFGGEFLDYTICILDTEIQGPDQIASRKRVGAQKWQDSV